jgi:hypothetical protein
MQTDGMGGPVSVRDAVRSQVIDALELLQQHHDLWPAYNPTVVHGQALSQVLFQQQQA